MNNALSPVDFSRDGQLAVIRMQGRHGNALNADLLVALRQAFARAKEETDVQGILFSSGGKLFSPGLDLQELVDLDRQGMTAFMELFAATLYDLYLCPRPVLAALSGHAVAGGCVLAMTADKRILRSGARIGLNEVKVGVPLPYAVTQLLRETVHRPALTDIALLGLNYRDEAAVQAGLVHECHDGDDFDAYCRDQLKAFTSRGSAALALTKSYLRQPTAERIRTYDASCLNDFVDCWFADDTQSRIHAIVDGLRKRG